jgi:ubiquinone/menaquinone biosynthesis C-methylase UbiE
MNGIHTYAVVRRLCAETLSFLGYSTFQREYWNLRAPEVARRYNHIFDFEVIGRLIQDHGIDSIADLGCGDGRLFRLYRRNGVRRLFGVDIADQMIGRAQERIANAEAPALTEVVNGDLVDPAVTIPNVDLVVTNRVLQHIHPCEIEQVVEKMANATRRMVYCNETHRRTTWLPHVFIHDYDAIMEQHGLTPCARGIIMPIDYEYTVYARASA